MKLPIQAQPVRRIVDASVGVSSGYEVSPSGECGQGKWCCQPIMGGPSFCVNCSKTVLGRCLTPAAVDCALHAAIPAYDC